VRPLSSLTQPEGLSGAKPAEIRFTDALPKTRSGKIMRRLLREIVTTHSVTGDVTTLEDMAVVNRLAAQHDEE
jgi:acetyl-CoA synthetase